MEGCVQMPVPEDQLQELVDNARNFAVSHGIVMRTKEHLDSSAVVEHAPFMLFPSPIPRAAFHQAQTVQTDFNLLMHKVAHDYDFMKEALKGAIQADDFTRRLWNIYETVRNEGKAQPISLGLIRSDYMLHTLKNKESDLSANVQLKQIEINMIASSFGGICSQLLHYHKFVLGTYGQSNYESRLPKNRAVEGLSGGMVAAWQIYDNPSAAVLFLVDSKEKNIYDQLFLRYGIHDHNPTIKVLRATLLDIHEKASLTKDNKLVYNNTEIAVVYYRAGYTDSEYAVDMEKTWGARLLLERSNAIKCPSVQYQLVGTKKIQQVLAKPGAVERFITEPDAVARIRATFAGQYSLDMGKEGDETVKLAMENPEKFVMKPQREGGGNNIYGEEIRTLLSKIQDTEERTSYILMERIHPAPVHNYAVRVGQPVQIHQMTSELGSYGVVLGSAEQVYKNEQCGHNLRTKTEGTNEGGVMVGFACLDTPYLI